MVEIDLTTYLRQLFQGRLIIDFNEFVQTVSVSSVGKEIGDILQKFPIVTISYGGKARQYVFLGSEVEFEEFINRVFTQQAITAETVFAPPNTIADFLLQITKPSSLISKLSIEEQMFYLLNRASKLNYLIHPAKKIEINKYSDKVSTLFLTFDFPKERGYLKEIARKLQLWITKETPHAIHIRFVRISPRFYIAVNKQLIEQYKFDTKVIQIKGTRIGITGWNPNYQPKEVYLINDKQTGIALIIR